MGAMFPCILKMPFVLDSAKQILIYGYSARGQQFCKELEKNNYFVLGFIDRNAEHYCDGKKPVFTLDKVKVWNMEKKKSTLIIIALQNALEHQRLAEFLRRDGFNKIIYLPCGRNECGNKAAELRKIYNRLLEEQFEIGLSIPFYDEVQKPLLDISNAIIQQDNHSVTFWARMESIFVNRVCRKEINKIGLEYYGVSLPATKHYISIFQFFENGVYNKEACEEYLEAQGYLDENYNIITDKLQDRYELFCLYKRKFNEGMEFFETTPPRVDINCSGGLNITDGLHRSVFLYMQRLSYLPVKVDKKSFNDYFMTDALNEIIEYMKVERITETLTPISHPAFFQFLSQREKNEKSVLTVFREFIGTIDIDSKRIIDISNYNSYFARNSRRMTKNIDCSYICSVETEEKWFGFAELLNKLLHIEKIDMIFSPFDSLQLPQQFDIVFILGKLTEYYYDYKVLNMINNITEGILVWESGTDNIQDEIEQILKYTEFISYRKLHTYYDGIVHEVGIFYKNQNESF